LVDAMRIGPDNKADWKSLLRGPTFGTRHYFLHRRVWYNDPDPVYVRPGIPLNHAQVICSWVALSGQLNLSSEWIPGMPPERLDILKRTMPSHSAVARPVDLFDNDLPRLWTVHAPDRDVIGVFNWESTDQEFDCSLRQLGLDPNTEYIGFDYWNNKLSPSLKGGLKVTVPAESCRILAIRPRAPHPQVISTSRHVTQGMIDLIDEKWTASDRSLTGVSQVVGGDRYELRVATDAIAEVITVSAADREAGVRAALLPSQPGLIRATIDSAKPRKVSWSLKF
jgi:hypothetical protein